MFHDDEKIKLLQEITTILNNIPFERRGYEQERWREYWIRHFEEKMKE